jgi:hypothetical protein
MIPTERRKYGRASLTLIVSRLGEGGTRYFFGYATNLSAGGLLIPSINPRSQGEQFSITFQAPGSSEWAVCRCEVVRNLGYDPTQKQKPGFGVKFLDLPQKTEKVIERWVESRQR